MWSRSASILAALLAELRSDSSLSGQVDALDAKLGAPIASEQFPELLASLTQVVALRIKRIESARQEMEGLLGHMVGKLDEIGRFATDQHRSQSESQASSETLNIQLAGEIKAMGKAWSRPAICKRFRQPTCIATGRRSVQEHQ